MPNVLAHFGAQGITSQTLIRSVDPRWVLLACVVPDIPWILQRAVRALAPSVDPYSLRLYAIVQSSLAFCLFVSVGLALLSRRPRIVLLVLALGSLLHLLLDAAQTRWANGVHFFAPFSWKLANFGLFWPENPSSYLLAGLGLGYFVWAWRSGRMRGERLLLLSPVRSVVALVIVCAYLASPILFRAGPQAADNHFVCTLALKSERTGRYVEFDRNTYREESEGDALTTFAGETLDIAGPRLGFSGTVSVRGEFLDPTTIVIREVHRHRAGWRNFLNYSGLVLVAVSFLAPGVAQRIGHRRVSSV